MAPLDVPANAFEKKLFHEEEKEEEKRERVDSSLNTSSRLSEKKQLKARFIKESFLENFTVEQNKKFEKVWTFRNDGVDTWPSTTKFIYTNGDKFGELEKEIGKEVKKDEFIDISIQF